MSDKRPLVGLGVLIYNENGQILLGKRISSHGSGDFGPPGGHLEHGETFRECAIRECEEEVGFVPDDIQFLTVLNDIFPGGKHYVSIMMTAKIPQGTEVYNMEPHKIENWEWFDENQLPENLFLPVKNLYAQKNKLEPA